LEAATRRGDTGRGRSLGGVGGREPTHEEEGTVGEVGTSLAAAAPGLGDALQRRGTGAHLVQLGCRAQRANEVIPAWKVCRAQKETEDNRAFKVPLV